MRRFGDELNEVAQEMVGRSVSDLNRCIRPCPKGCGRSGLACFGWFDRRAPRDLSSKALDEHFFHHANTSLVAL